MPSLVFVITSSSICWTGCGIGLYQFLIIALYLYIDCLFEIRKIAVCFLWLSLPGDYRVTDEALLAETT